MKKTILMLACAAILGVTSASAQNVGKHPQIKHRMEKRDVNRDAKDLKNDHQTVKTDKANLNQAKSSGESKRQIRKDQAKLAMAKHDSRKDRKDLKKDAAGSSSDKNTTPSQK